MAWSVGASHLGLIIMWQNLTIRFLSALEFGGAFER